jgi:NADH-quinone oxidoreductase subunit J
MILLFTIFAILTVAGAVAAICLRNLVHSVLALTVAFAGLAIVYMVLGAQFIGLAQILVYIGAVAILIVFAVLLTRDTGASPQAILVRSWKQSIAVAIAVFAVLWWAIQRSAVSRLPVTSPPEASTRQIGDALMLRFALPLELVGLLLTAALIGAVTIAMRDRKAAR